MKFEKKLRQSSQQSPYKNGDLTYEVNNLPRPGGQNLQVNSKVGDSVVLTEFDDEKSQTEKPLGFLKPILKKAKSNHTKSVGFNTQLAPADMRDFKLIKSQTPKTVSADIPGLNSELSQDDSFEQAFGDYQQPVKLEQKVSAFTSSMANHRMNSLSKYQSQYLFQMGRSTKEPQEDMQEKHQVLQNLIEKNKQDTWNQKPFEKAQFNQCIPNPDKPGEYITVQLLSLQLKELEMEDMLCNIENPDYTYQKYKVMKADMDSSQNGSVNSNSVVRRSTYKLQSSLRQKDIIQRNILSEFNAETTSVLQSHIIHKEKATPYERPWMKPGAEVAIIGFWRRENEEDPNSEFRCYFYFNCANPKKREVRRSDRAYTKKIVPVCAKQVLYVSSSQEKEIVFFFFWDHSSDSLMLAILNTIPQMKDLTEQERLFGRTARQYEVPVSKFYAIADPEIKRAIEILDFKKVDSSILVQNPHIIERFEPETVESSDQNARASASHRTLIINHPDRKKRDAKEGLLIFFNLDLGKVVKKVTDAKAFVSYKAPSDPGKKGILYYLSDQKFKKPSQELSLPRYMVKLTVNDQLEQKVDKESSEVMQLEFEGVDTRHIVNKQSKILEIFQHNDDQRLTVVTQCLNVYTFVKTDRDQSGQQPIMKLLYYIEADNVRARFQRTSSKSRELYVQTGITNILTIKSGSDAGYALGDITFYHVSAERNFEPQPHTKLPKRSFKIKVKLKKKFSAAYESQGDYLYLSMPVHFESTDPSRTSSGFDPTKECIVFGAAVCEEGGMNNLALSFYTSTFKKGKTRTNFPQEPLKQSYIVNYPILCYKTRQPDDRSITIVHLAQSIPQRVIHLGEWRFVCFVHLSYEVSTTTRQILFLAEKMQRQIERKMRQQVKLNNAQQRVKVKLKEETE